MRNSAIRSRWLLAVAIVVAVVTAGGMLDSWGAARRDPVPPNRLRTPALASKDAKLARPGQAPQFLPDSFAPVIRPDLPGVVYISTTKVIKKKYSSPFFNNPFFNQFFGNPQGQGQTVPEKEYALGSGVVVRSDGYILTNDHVIRGADDIHVRLRGGRDFKAKVVGADRRTDLAVLKINATGLTALQLGNSSNMHIGDIVFAIGDPFGVGETVTMGIVSAKNRTNVYIEGPNSIQNFIQTDAAINPGNSGGALINTHGRVIGINTAIETGGGRGGNIGIGFAIPINLARRVMTQLIEHGKVIRGQLGVIIQQVTPTLAKQFGLPKAEGALVSEINPNSPAQKAGLKRGDIILKFNGTPIKTYNQLVLLTTETAPGTIVHLQVFRNGHTREFTAKLEQSTIGKSSQTMQGPSHGSALAGVQVQTLTPEIADRLNLSPDTRGVVVTSISPSSPASGTFLHRGDVIQEVNHHAVNNVSEYNHAVQEAGDKPVLLLVNQAGQTIYMVIRPNGG